MGSRTQLLGLFLAMMTMNIIYMQSQQRLEKSDDSPVPESVSPAPAASPDSPEPTASPSPVPEQDS